MSAISAIAFSRAPAAVPAAVIRLTNLARLAAGRRRLRPAPALGRAAAAHATAMAAGAPFSHDSPDGTTWHARIRAAGYPDPAGENIAYGQPSAAAVVRAWLASPAHRANVLNRDFRTIGAGHAGVYWVQDFGY